METHDKRELIEINQLIDLTDKPVGLAYDDIGWSRVRSNASNCICCCCNNSVTLVTTDDSYILDHVPLDNIQFAQANPNLQYLAMSNHRKIAIIDLVDNDIKSGFANSSSNNNNNTLTNETKIVNLTAAGLTMSDIIFWRWLDNSCLAILSYEALYTCSVNQQHINHHAYTAFSSRSRYLTMEKIFNTNSHFSTLCQVTDIQRDISGNFYSISSLYSTSSLVKINHSNTQHSQQPNSPHQSTATHSNSSPLRPSFGSVPSRLSQLVSNDQSFNSLKSEQLSFENRRYPTFNQSFTSSAAATNANEMGEVCGLVQIHCNIRDLSQLIQAHTITFTNPIPPVPASECLPTRSSETRENPTILVAVNKVCNQMRVHFIEMATSLNHSSSGQNATQTTRFNQPSNGGVDFPTSIVCSHVNPTNNNNNPLHVALVTTKHGQLFVYSVAHSTILFSTSITTAIISSTILESNVQGLMVICRNGQVLLVKLNLDKLMRLLDESKTLRHISSSHNLLNSTHSNQPSTTRINSSKKKPTSSSVAANSQLSASLDIGLEVLISTKL